MFFERLRPALQTFRFRLMLWNAAVVVVSSLATVIGLREGVRLMLLHEMDQILIEDVGEIVIAIQEPRFPHLDALQDDLNRKARGHQQHEWYVQLLNAQGREIWSSVNRPATPPIMPAVNDMQPVSVGNYRLLEHRLQETGMSIAEIRVGASLRFLTEDMARIDRLVGVAAGIALLVAPLCGYWLAGRAIRPLTETTRTAARLRPSRLDERLPIRDTGDELDQLSLTINGLLDRIAHYLEQKRDFLANSAHELRSPLAAIRSSVEVALNSGRTLEEYEELLSEIIEESTTLEILVNQLLLLAETDAERLKEQGDRLAFDTVISRSVDMFEGVADSRGIRLEARLQPDIYVRGNRYHLRQVVNNLLDNAIKFTPGGGQIDATLELDAAGVNAVLCVSDTGVGIHADELPHVFERFYRGDKSRNRKAPTSGTGLGLSICEAIVEGHAGEIDITSQAGHGTTVTVRLPLAKCRPDNKTG